MKTLSFDKDACQDFDWALKREWLETNGLGGYSSSTLIGTNTRRYHGLLVMATKPPQARYVLLSNVEETLFIGARKFPFYTNIHADGVKPKGYNNLVKFLLSPIPTFIYQVEDVLIEKTIFMVYGENTTVVSYKLLQGDAEKVRLEVSPKLAYRDFHSLGFEDPELNKQLVTDKGSVRVSPYAHLPSLNFYHNAAIVNKTSEWLRQVQLTEEKERGYECEEDLYKPFSLIFTFLNQDQVYFLASTQEKENVDLKKIVQKEEKRRNKLEEKIPEEIKKEAVHTLWRNAHNFIVKSQDGHKRVIAGYHWFEDWGRDTFISLSGLTLATGQYKEAKDLLLGYSRFVSQGMIPNYFPDLSETPEYNSVDASLWYINAIYEYYRTTEDDKTISKKLYGTIKKIIKYYKDGTRFNIHMEENGLLFSGDETTNLTWMDARLGEKPITHRSGMPVEVNALWYNALKIMELFTALFEGEEESLEFQNLALKTKESFNKTFWNKKKTCLYDVVNGDELDDRIRPNQLLAISLPFPVLSSSRWKPVMKKVEDELLTPVGLRSLSPKEEGYQGTYVGDPLERDQIYHQGCVWPWLIGPYIFASLRTFGRTKTIRRRLLKILDFLLTHLEEAGLGDISEIFDGDEPFSPRGTIAQASSTAEILRSYMELVKDDLKLEKVKEMVLK